MAPQLPAGTSRAAVPVYKRRRQVGRATTTGVVADAEEADRARDDRRAARRGRDDSRFRGDGRRHSSSACRPRSSRHPFSIRHGKRQRQHSRGIINDSRTHALVPPTAAAVWRSASSPQRASRRRQGAGQKPFEPTSARPARTSSGCRRRRRSSTRCSRSRRSRRRTIVHGSRLGRRPHRHHRRQAGRDRHGHRVRTRTWSRSPQRNAARPPA